MVCGTVVVFPCVDRLLACPGTLPDEESFPSEREVSANVCRCHSICGKGFCEWGGAKKVNRM